MSVMPGEDAELWEKLSAFRIDESPHAVLDFESRLARENGWSLSFSGRVVEEYRRFLYLCMRAGHMVTPSEEVDQAWHLHLVYTRSYWERLCGEVLGRPIHHNPTSGGAAEGGRFHDCYEQTLESYRRCFGEEPPSDIWPPAEERFRSNESRWIDTSRNWIVPRPRFVSRISRHVPKFGIAVLGLLATLTMTGCVADFLDYKGPQFLALFLTLIPIAFLLSWIFGRIAQARGYTNNPEPPQDPYEIAFLAGGGKRVMQAMVARLYGGNLIDLRNTKSSGVKVKKKTGDPESGQALTVLEARALSAFPIGSPEKIGVVGHSLKPVFNGVREQLQSAGFIQTSGERFITGLVAILPILVLIGIGLTKVVVGIDRGKPVGILVMLLFLTFILLVWRMTCISRRTKTGDRIWKELSKTRHNDLFRQVKAAPHDEAVLLMPLAIAVMGPSAVALADGYEGLDSAVLQRVGGSSSTSGGCGGGCGADGGGGCGGGGCGGCGGCGG